MSQDNWTKLVDIIAILLEIDTAEITNETSPEAVDQ